MWQALGITMLVLIAAAKVCVFGQSVRQALTGGEPANHVDPDGPDEGWRWWEEFEPNPGPQPQSPDRVLLRRS